MVRRVGRLSLIAGAALVVLVGTSLMPARGDAMARTSSLARPSLRAGGVPAAVAARSLNALSRRNAAHAGKSLKEVHFILNWLPNVEFAGLWMAEKQKAWAKAGL